MVQRVLPGQVTEDFSDFFGRFREVSTAELLRMVASLFQYVLRIDDPMQLVALWRTLDFFESEVPEADKHRTMAIRGAVLDRLRERGEYTLMARLRDEGKDRPSPRPR